jgi:hypothetical protein
MLSKPQFSLRLHYGTILCSSANLTNNECYRHPAFYCYPTASSASDTCCVSYSTIVNNIANGGYGCIWLNNGASTHFFDTCNVLNNKQTDASNSIGTIRVNANLLIKNSCILGNNEYNKVFSETYSSGKITLSNCTIDDDIFSNGRYTGSLTISKSIGKSFINALSHISTRNCDSYFDSFGTLSAKPNVPSKNPLCLKSCICKHPIIDPLVYI